MTSEIQSCLHLLFTRGISKADRGCLHAAAVSRYDGLKRGINGASETVVIDVSFFTGSCLAIRRRVGIVMAELHLVLSPAPRISTRVRIRASRQFSLYPTVSKGAIALAGGSDHSTRGCGLVLVLAGYYGHKCGLTVRVPAGSARFTPSISGRPTYLHFLCFCLITSQKGLPFPKPGPGGGTIFRERMTAACSIHSVMERWLVPCAHELSADKTSKASQLGITPLPYHIGSGLACPRELSGYDGARISPTVYTSPL